MQERLNCITGNIQHCILFQNIIVWEIAINTQGQQLIAIKVGDIKLGYVTDEYIQGVVLTKTFLLLTNNSNPEGEKLKALLSPEKNDSQYLDLDKLSHFVKSDIPTNKELYNYFKEAGYHKLFEVDEKLFERHMAKNIHVELIEEYIFVAHS